MGAGRHPGGTSGRDRATVTLVLPAGRRPPRRDVHHAPASTPRAEGIDVRAALAELEAALPGLFDHNEPDDPGMHTTSRSTSNTTCPAESSSNWTTARLSSVRGHRGPERDPPRLAQPVRRDRHPPRRADRRHHGVRDRHRGIDMRSRRGGTAHAYLQPPTATQPAVGEDDDYASGCLVPAVGRALCAGLLRPAWIRSSPACTWRSPRPARGTRGCVGSGR